MAAAAKAADEARKVEQARVETEKTAKIAEEARKAEITRI